MRPHPLVGLQQTIGNHAVGQLLGDFPIQRSWFGDRENDILAGMGDDGADWGGDHGPWWWLNGFSPEDLTKMLRALGPARRKQLRRHLADAKSYDEPRLEAALNAVDSGDLVTARRALELVDAVRNAGNGTITWQDLFTQLLHIPASARKAALSRVDHADLVLMRDQITEAPAPDQAGIAELLNDLLAPPAKTVLLDFIPDEKSEVSARGNLVPVGQIHVTVKGSEVAVIEGRGGPWMHMRKEGHNIDPSKPGTYTLGGGAPVITSWWVFSQLADGTPLRDTTDAGGNPVVEFQRGGRWVRTTKLAKPITRDDILAAEKDNGRPEAIPTVWDLNDFGQEGWHVGDTDMFLHTTPDTEDEYAKKLPEKLGFSHGCVHIKPSDRDMLIRNGWLRRGVRIKIHEYDPSRLGLWGKPPH